MINIKIASLKDVRLRDYAIRFLFGGLATVAAGLIADHFGPEIGGVFLAFPAIFPAGASLLEQHEKKKKKKDGFDGTKRGRLAASVDSTGASIGCLGLMGFAFICSQMLPGHRSAAIIVLATVVWLVTSIGFWKIRQSGAFRQVRKYLTGGRARPSTSFH